MSKIKTPVRYDDGSDFSSNPCIRDADGHHICELSAWQFNWPAQGGKDTDEITPAYGHAIGNQIATAINEHADLKTRLADANRGAQVNALVNESLATKLKLAVEALKVYADVENWNEEQFEAFDAEGIEWSSVRFVFDNGDSDDSPISVARTALAKIKEPSKGGEQR